MEGMSSDARFRVWHVDSHGPQFQFVVTHQATALIQEATEVEDGNVLHCPNEIQVGS